jgi:transcriptional regulator with XRE-family HTH domain
MANRTRAIQDAGIIGRRLQAELGNELREARLARGLRQHDVARSIGLSRFHVSRIERGDVGQLGLAALSRHGAVVGLRLHARFYPSGSGLRDAGQLDLLRRFRARVGDKWTWHLEAPLNIPGDLRAFDLLLTGATTIAVEAITGLRDAQAQLRAATLKQRDGRAERLVILLSASHANRDALRLAADLLSASFPLGTKATLAAVAAGDDPGANGIVVL